MYAASDNVNDGGQNAGTKNADDQYEGLRLRHALGGLQAGVLGSLLIFVSLMIGSLWDGRSIWVVPNLFASTFFGSGAYRNQLLGTSWTGIALIVAIYGVLGALWGCAWRDTKKPRLWIYGAVFGLCVYFLFRDVLWRYWNPLISLYAPDRQLQVGHLLWGMMLGRSPLYARRIARSAKEAGVHQTAGQDVKSGEVIQ